MYLYLVYDTTAYSRTSIPEQIIKFMRFDMSTMSYLPIIFLSDFWLLKKDLVLVNETVNELNLTLHYNTYSLNYFMFTK
jgi:hypothetical protein